MQWIKSNKLSTFLVLVVFFLLFRSFTPVDTLNMSLPTINKGASEVGTFDNLGSSGRVSLPSSVSYQRDYTPTTQTNRIVVEETSMSLVVLKVKETADKIAELAKTAGGYMVSTNISQPQEAPFASIVVRIPAEKLKSTIEEYRKLSIKVTSENVIGTDVTDQYVDLEARLRTLETTKSKFQEIMNRAIQVQDILTVQRELINLQDQIDGLKGRQKYLEQTAALSKVTLYLSSDEMSLPYAPSQTFRPNVIFKLAVRSLVNTLRGFAEKGIWIIVYGVIWLPILLIIFLYKRWKDNKIKA